jgi:UTP:GlnB (protein PII) uridylyltransferase
MSTLTDSFLQSLVAELDDENTVGVTMTGSYARGEGGPYSDVNRTLKIIAEAGY